jgi:hypothetical protein
MGNLKIVGYADEKFTSALDGGEYEVMLNPEKLQWGRRIQDDEETASDGSAPASGSSKTLSEKLRFELDIDCTGVVDDKRVDMQAEIAQLSKVLYAYNGENHRPNYLIINWEHSLAFKCVLTSCNLSYTLFRPDGTPLRARVALEFMAHNAGALEERATAPFGVNNAGLVILQSWIHPLFTHLGLIENDRFRNREAQQRAVHILQFLATGQRETSEQFLLLNKVLCGLERHKPVEAGIEMSAEDEAICLSLLEAVVVLWRVIEKSSVDGLRGNWLVRDGSLSESDALWSLVVKKRAYDVLLARFPSSYSIVKLPWMEKAIYVSWAM